MTPAGTSNELDVQNGWEENTHKTHKNPARGHKVEKHHSEGKNVRRTLHTKSKWKWYRKSTRKRRHLKKTTKNACGYRGACISKDDSTKGRGFNESIKTKTKQDKTNVRPDKDVMTSANQTPGGHKFAPLVADQQGRANQHEPACFGLSYPLSFPSRSGIYHCMP